MYTCTMCGMKKSDLGSNPEFEFRSRRRQDEEAYIEGISDWCSKCEALRFFIKANEVKEPAQYLEEQQQPKRQLVNHILDATANSWQEKSRSRSKSSRHGKDMSPSPNRKNSRDRRHEAHKVMRRELLANLPSQLPRGSLWDHKMRSCSEDRDRRSRRTHSSEQRSKSVINEPQGKAHVFMLQAQDHSSLAKDIVKLGFPQPVKHAQLDESSDPDEAELRNDLDMQLNAAADDECAPIRYKNKQPIGKLQQLELVNPWQEEVQRRTNQMMTSGVKKERHSSRNRHMDASVPKASDYDEAGRFIDFASDATNKGVVVKDLLNDLQGLEPTEEEDQLAKKLLEKKQLVSEWERIRRRVESECDRAKGELDELKQQRDKEAKRSTRDSPTVVERQRGGAHLEPPYGKIDPASDLEIKHKKSYEKTIGDALDEKLETMLETLRESPQHGEPQADELDESSNFQPSAPAQSQTDITESAHRSDIDEDDTEEELPEVSKLHGKSEQSDADNLKPKHLLSKLHMLVSTVQRARFRGFPEDPQELLHKLNTTELMKRRDPPPAQFSTLPCSPNELISLLSMKREVLEPHMARPLKVCRSPIFCPDADCRRMFFISDFNDHLTHEHPSLAMERISPGKAKTFFLDTRITLLNKAKCNMVYFVKDKFFDRNTDRYPDLLPVLVMSARLEMSEFFGSNDKGNQLPTCSIGPDHEIFLIWLTSIRPDDVKIVGTISVWPTSSQPIVEYLMVQTNEVYNIRSAQKLKNIYCSNRVMALPGSFVNRMTDGGKSLLAVQVLIH